MDENAAVGATAWLQPPPALESASSSADAPLVAEGSILDAAQRALLAAALPRAQRQGWSHDPAGLSWRLLYSLRKHGASLETLLNRAADRRDTLLVVRDDRGAVFGCFTAEPWARVRGYFGSGDAWVFTFERRVRADALRARIVAADERRALRREELRRRDDEAEIARAAAATAAAAAGGADAREGGVGAGGASFGGSGAGEAEAQAAPAADGAEGGEDDGAPPLSSRLSRATDGVLGEPGRRIEVSGVSIAAAGGAGGADSGAPRVSEAGAEAVAARAPASAPAGAASARPVDRPPSLHTYRWSRRNRHFQYVSLVPNAKQTRVATGLGLGGGDHFAIHLDDCLDRGCSGPCQTFLSPMLSSAEDNGDDGDARTSGEGGAEADDDLLDARDLGKDGVFRAVEVELFVVDGAL